MTWLFETAIAYPRFFFEFLTLVALEPYRGAGEMSFELLVYYVVGAALAFALTMVMRSREAPEPSERDSDHGLWFLRTRSTGETLVRLSVVILGGSLALHGLMRLYSALVSPVVMGAAADTVNAALAYGAVYLPINGAVTRIGHRMTRVMATLKPTQYGPKVVKLLIAAFQLMFPAYYLIGLSTTYNTSLRETVRPVLISAVGTVVAATAVAAIVLLIMRGNPPVKG